MAEMPPLCVRTLSFISYDEDWTAGELPQLPSYVAGNQRVLAQQGIDGALWALSAQLASLCSAGDAMTSADGLASVVLCNGIQGRQGPVCWTELELDDGRMINTSDSSHWHQTGYYQGVLPQTCLCAGPLQLTVSTLAPVQPVDQGPARRPAAILYQTQVVNTGRQTESGRLRLRIQGQAYGVRGAEGWRCPGQSFRHAEGRLVLALESETPLHLVFWSAEATTIEAGPRPSLETPFELAPGETYTFRVWLAFEPGVGNDEASVLPMLREIEAEEWLASTLEYWETRLGAVSISPPTVLSDFLRRAAQECLTCIRVNDGDEVVGVVSAPVPTEEKPHFSDLLLVCWPALELEPALYARVIAWAVEQVTASELTRPLDTQARVTPAIMAGLLYRRTGSAEFLSRDPQTVAGIERLLESVVERREGTSGLLPTEVMHGYEPLIPFELGTNVECWAAFHGWAEVLDALDRHEESARWHALATATKECIRRSFATTGPGKGGWHYAGLRLVAAYRLDPLHYYEHDALDIAIAPFLGFCTEQHRPWLNTMQHMFSATYDLVKSRSSTAIWWKPIEVGWRREKHTCPSVVARLAAVQDKEELDRALLALEQAIDVNGVLWSRSAEGTERTMRCAREMGAAYGLLMRRLLGLQIDGAQASIIYRPRNPWRVTCCMTRLDNGGVISAWQAQGSEKAQARIVNGTARGWTVQMGFCLDRSFEVRRIWVHGQPYDGEVAIEEDDGGRVVLLVCDLPAGTEVTAAIEAVRQPPPDFAEVAAVA